jgi:hypothetical protein
MERRNFLQWVSAGALTGNLNAAPAQQHAKETDAMASAKQTPATPFHVSGVIPSLSVKADILPTRSECGIGALMAWANRLWLITYVSHKAGTGAGTGLYEIDENLTMRKHSASVVGTYANRMVHAPTHQVVIGPHVIDAGGKVRTVQAIQEHRLTATMEHLEDPAHKVYFLTMEGLLFEVDVNTLRAKQVADLIRELGLQGARPHFKGGHTSNKRVIVANNTYDESDFEGKTSHGRLAEWDGNKWTILERKPFYEVTGRKNMGQVIFATGWDRASAILKVFAKGQWSTYRLPKATHCLDHWWQTEWPRIREVESERYLMDCHGMFYELSPVAYSGKIWGVRPIATHLRIIPDFCSWRGFLVLAGNQVTPIGDSTLLAGEPQAGLWFGKTDDLWQFGKPKGWGGVWWEQAVAANQPSDPFLMTGFEQKVLHLSHDASRAVDFVVEVDFLGNQTWKTYDTIRVPANGYTHHEFPPGFSAHWARVTASAKCAATACFVYT